MNEELKQYIFKGIYTDYYVSPNGDIYSNKRNDMYKLKPTKSTRGYVKVRLSIDGKIYNRHIHRMVAETFIPNPENKPEVNHIDGNKKNNTVTNLEWVTRKENAEHAYRTGLFGIGESFSTADISNKQCKKICKLLESTDMSIKDIAEKVNCGKMTVYHILHGDTWKHVSCNYDFSHRKLFKHITESEAREIHRLLNEGELSSKEIAEVVGCKVHHVKDIKRGKTWTKLS
jgi:DNA-binding CsgD family transcriptional regulator